MAGDYMGDCPQVLASLNFLCAWKPSSRFCAAPCAARPPAHSGAGEETALFLLERGVASLICPHPPAVLLLLTQADESSVEAALFVL